MKKNIFICFITLLIILASCQTETEQIISEEPEYIEGSLSNYLTKDVENYSGKYIRYNVYDHKEEHEITTTITVNVEGGKITFWQDTETSRSETPEEQPDKIIKQHILYSLLDIKQECGGEIGWYLYCNNTKQNITNKEFSNNKITRITINSEGCYNQDEKHEICDPILISQPTTIICWLRYGDVYCFRENDGLFVYQSTLGGGSGAGTTYAFLE